MTDMTDEVSTSLKSISHPIRVQILLILADRLNNGFQFSDLSRELRIESSGKLSFHLEKLDDLVSQDDSSRYHLNKKGLKAVEAIKILGVRGSDQQELDRPEINTVVDEDTASTFEEQPISEDPVAPTSQSYLAYLLTFAVVQLVFGLAVPFALGSYLAEQQSVDPSTYILPGIGIASITVGIILYLIVSMEQVSFPLSHLGDILILAVFIIYAPLQAFGVSARTIIAYGSNFYLRSTFYVLVYLVLLGLGISIAAVLDKTRSVELSDMLPTVLGRKWYAVVCVVTSTVLTIPFVINHVEIEQQRTSVLYDSSNIGTAGLNALLITIVALYFFGSLTEIGKSITPIHTVMIFLFISIFQFISALSHPSIILLYRFAFADFAIWVLIEILASINFVLGSYIGTKVVRANLPS